MTLEFSTTPSLDVTAILATVTCDIGLPVVTSQVLHLINSGNSNANSIAEIVANDQTMSLRLLKLANSSFYGFARRINTVRDAVVILGEKTLFNMVLAMSLKGMHASFGVVEQNIWTESVAFAMAARFIATKTHCTNPEEAFIAGLMSNVGELICNNDNPDNYKQILNSCRNSVNREECAAQLLAYPLATYGAAFLSSCNFPNLLVLATLYADQPELSGDAEEELFVMCAVVHLARLMCKALQLGAYDPQPAVATIIASDYALPLLGIDAAEELSNFMAEFATLFAERSNAMIGS